MEVFKEVADVIPDVAPADVVEAMTEGLPVAPEIAN